MKVREKEPVKPVRRSLWYSTKTRNITTWIVEIVIVLALSAVFSYIFCSSVTVLESSMDPTLQAGNRVMINRVSYTVGKIKRGDLIAYTNSDSTAAATLINTISSAWKPKRITPTSVAGISASSTMRMM